MPSMDSLNLVRETSSSTAQWRYQVPCDEVRASPKLDRAKARLRALMRVGNLPEKEGCADWAAYECE
jgi:hypothetical protein